MKEYTIRVNDYAAACLLEKAMEKDGWRITGKSIGDGWRDLYAIPPANPVEFTPDPIHVNLPNI